MDKNQENNLIEGEEEGENKKTPQKISELKPALKPIENIPLEKLPETLYKTILDMVVIGDLNLDQVLADSNIKDYSVWSEINLGLKGVKPVPLTFETDGLTTNYLSKLKDSIDKRLQELNLSGSQNLDYLNIRYGIANPDEINKPGEQRKNVKTGYQKLISTY